MIYSWKRDLPMKAQAVGTYLGELERQHGIITPHLLVDQARASDNLLHGHFEWDDAQAAERYREVQAGYLIRNLVVTMEHPTEPGAELCVRAFVHVKDEQSPGFLLITTVLRDDDLTTEMLARALRELNAFRTKYSMLQVLAGVMYAIDAVLEEGKYATAHPALD